MLSWTTQTVVVCLFVFGPQTPAPYKPYPSVHAPWFGYLFWVSASAGGYNKGADTQFTAAWIEKKAPAPPPTPAPAPAPAPASNSTTSATSTSTSSSGAALKNANTGAPANVVTEQGSKDNKVYDKDGNQQASSSNADKRLPATTEPAKQQQSGGRKLLQATGPCEANIKVCVCVCMC
jgi:hypothetical protein